MDEKTYLLRHSLSVRDEATYDRANLKPPLCFVKETYANRESGQ